MRFALLNSAGEKIGEFDLNPDPRHWEYMGVIGVFNRQNINIKLSGDGRLYCGMIYEPDEDFAAPITFRYPLTLHSGDTVVFVAGAIELPHFVAEKFIRRGFYD